MIDFKNTKKGLTLIEIIVVLTIIIIIFGIGIVSFRTLRPKMELNGSTKNLIENLRYAQQLSVSDQINHRVVFSTSTDQKYSIVKHNNTTTTIKEIELPEGIEFKSISSLVNNEIQFNSYGAVKESGNVVLINSKGATTTIKIRPSGFIKKN